MSSKRRAPSTTFAVTTAIIAAAVLARWLLTPWMGSAFPLATMFAAIALAVWYGGWLPALYTTIAGYIICDWLFIPGIGLFGRGDLRAELIGLSVYFGSCLSIMALGHAMRVAQASLEAGHRDLSSTNLALTSRIEAHSLLASIVASSDDAIISKTLEGIITSWNAGAERLFGYTEAEAIGQSIMLIVPPERRDEELSILDRIRQGQRVEHLDVVRVAKDGRRVDVSRDRVAGARPPGAHHRGLEDRPRHHRAQRSGSGAAAAGNLATAAGVGARQHARADRARDGDPRNRDAPGDAFRRDALRVCGSGRDAGAAGRSPMATRTACRRWRAAIASTPSARHWSAT